MADIYVPGSTKAQLANYGSGGYPPPSAPPPGFQELTVGGVRMVGLDMPVDDDPSEPFLPFGYTRPLWVMPHIPPASDYTATPSNVGITVGDGSASLGLTLASSFAGGDDDGTTGHFDSTSHLNLFSYQRANVKSWGEVIRTFLMRYDAKAMHAWYGPQGLYDGFGNPVGTTFKPWTWIGSHYEANDHNSIHGHWEIEVPDSTGALQGRFTVDFADQTTGVIGLDKTRIGIWSADLHVVLASDDHTGTYQQGYLRLIAPAGREKAMEWNNDNAGAQTARRWKLFATSTAESGSNAGTDLAINAYDDSGNILTTPFQIVRSSGQVQLGYGSSVKIRTSVNPALDIEPTATGGQAIQVIGTDATAQALKTQETADTVSRHVTYVDGKHEWGSGTATRDTNLYRSAAGILKSDGKLVAATGLGVGNAASATTSVGSLVQKIQVFDASGASLGYVPVYSSIT